MPARWNVCYWRCDYDWVYSEVRKKRHVHMNVTSLVAGARCQISTSRRAPHTSSPFIPQGHTSCSALILFYFIFFYIFFLFLYLLDVYKTAGGLVTRVIGITTLVLSVLILWRAHCSSPRKFGIQRNCTNTENITQAHHWHVPKQKSRVDIIVSHACTRAHPMGSRVGAPTSAPPLGLW